MRGKFTEKQIKEFKQHLNNLYLVNGKEKSLNSIIIDYFIKDDVKRFVENYYLSMDDINTIIAMEIGQEQKVNFLHIKRIS